MHKDAQGWVWTTREGEQIRLEDIMNRHLLNIARYLDRQICECRSATALYVHPVLGPHGEMAQMDADHAMEQIWEQERVFISSLRVIEKEIIRRGLPLPFRTQPEPLPNYELVEVTVLGRIYKRIEEA